MIKKNYTKSGKTCRVTFRIPKGSGAVSAALCGTFNNWDPDEDPMRRLKDGSFSLQKTLQVGQKYHYRYFLDNARWENDEAADGYEPNEFGVDNSVVEV